MRARHRIRASESTMGNRGKLNICRACEDRVRDWAPRYCPSTAHEPLAADAQIHSTRSSEERTGSCCAEGRVAEAKRTGPLEAATAPALEALPPCSSPTSLARSGF